MELGKKTLDGYDNEGVLLGLCEGLAGESYETFQTRILNEVAPDISARTGAPLRVTLTCEKAPLSLFPFRKEKRALITCLTDKRTEISDPSLLGAAAAAQSVPRAPRSLPTPEEESPVICMLTLFNKKSSISRDLYFDRWFNHHTPFSLKHFPLIGYVRNVLVNAQGEKAPFSDAAVEEFCSSPRDLVRPWRFFRTVLLLPFRLIQLYFDVSSFIDMGSVRTYYCRSYRVESKEDSNPF